MSLSNSQLLPVPASVSVKPRSRSPVSVNPADGDALLCCIAEAAPPIPSKTGSACPRLEPQPRRRTFLELQRQRPARGWGPGAVALKPWRSANEIHSRRAYSNFDFKCFHQPCVAEQSAACGLPKLGDTRTAKTRRAEARAAAWQIIRIRGTGKTAWWATSRSCSCGHGESERD